MEDRLVCLYMITDEPTIESIPEHMTALLSDIDGVEASSLFIETFDFSAYASKITSFTQTFYWGRKVHVALAGKQQLEIAHAMTAQIKRYVQQAKEFKEFFASFENCLRFTRWLSWVNVCFSFAVVHYSL